MGTHRIPRRFGMLASVLPQCTPQAGHMGAHVFLHGATWHMGKHMFSHVKRFYMGKLKTQEIPCKILREIRTKLCTWKIKILIVLRGSIRGHDNLKLCRYNCVRPSVRPSNAPIKKQNAFVIWFFKNMFLIRPHICPTVQIYVSVRPSARSSVRPSVRPAYPLKKKRFCDSIFQKYVSRPSAHMSARPNICVRPHIRPSVRLSVRSSVRPAAHDATFRILKPPLPECFFFNLAKYFMKPVTQKI